MDELDALWAFLVAAALAFGAAPPSQPPWRAGLAPSTSRGTGTSTTSRARIGGLAILVAVLVGSCSSCPTTAHPRDPCGAVAIALVGASDDPRRAGCRRW